MKYEAIGVNHNKLHEFVNLGLAHDLRRSYTHDHENQDVLNEQADNL